MSDEAFCMVQDCSCNLIRVCLGPVRCGAFLPSHVPCHMKKISMPMSFVTFQVACVMTNCCFASSDCSSALKSHGCTHTQSLWHDSESSACLGAMNYLSQAFARGRETYTESIEGHVWGIIQRHWHVRCLVSHEIVTGSYSEPASPSLPRLAFARKFSKGALAWFRCHVFLSAEPYHEQ